jgi:hypothetical protein
MFERPDISTELERLRYKTRSEEDKLISEATRILKKDLFAESNILENLKQYNKAVEVVDEEDVDSHYIYTASELKKIAVLYRLKFLESKVYKPGIPYEAILKIKYLNGLFKKEIRLFSILSLSVSFTDKASGVSALLFAKTNYDNYYLVHSWGSKVSWWRSLKFWPLRNFENLFVSILTATLIITLSLPTRLISLDPKAEYWSGYRAAAFFHLLIFNMGVTAYFTFAFSKNFSSTTWNSEKDF